MSPSGGDPLDPDGSGGVLRGRCGIGLGVPTTGTKVVSALPGFRSTTVRYLPFSLQHRCDTWLASHPPVSFWQEMGTSGESRVTHIANRSACDPFPGH